MPRKHELPPEKRYREMENGCWEWLGCVDPMGYGRLYHPEKKRSYLAHRFFYERDHGEVPEGTLDHLCRNPRCVNPGHLDPTTRQENVRRGKNAKLTWDLVREIRASTVTPKKLAPLYGVAPCTISNIRSGRIWPKEQEVAPA